VGLEGLRLLACSMRLSKGALCILNNVLGDWNVVVMRVGSAGSRGVMRAKLGHNVMLAGVCWL
jgi:hypothetical protein